MAINFPNSPTLDQTFSSGNNTYIWNGNAWVGYSTATSPGGTVVSSQWGTVATGIHTLSNVGIGTTNATSALTVKGNTSLETLNISGVSTFGVNLDIKGFGDDSIIEHTNASLGDLYLLSKRGTYIRTANGEASGYFRANGAVELYYNNSKKFETLGTGVTVTGTTFTNQLSVSGVSTLNSLSIGKVTNLIDLSSGNDPFNANNIINVGGDMAIFHLNDGTFGTSNRILLNENNLVIGTKGEVTGSTYYSDLITVSVGNDVNFPNTSNVALGHGNGGYKLETLGVGVTVTGTTFTNQLSVSGVSTFSNVVRLPDNISIQLGNAQDLNISHDGSSSNIEAFNNTLRLKSSSNDIVHQAPVHTFKNGVDNETLAVFTQNGSVELYYDNSKKFETLGVGATTYGIHYATTFVGDGSGLTNIVATGSGVEIRDSGSVVGTASTIDFGDNLTVSAISAGIVTVTGGSPSKWTTVATGIHTLSNVGIGTTNATSSLTVKGDSSFTGTATINGVTNTSQLNVTGVGTFGVAVDIKSGITNTYINPGAISFNSTGSIQQIGSVQFYRATNYTGSGNAEYYFSNYYGGFDHKAFYVNAAGATELYYNENKKLETTNTGITVTGTTVTSGLSVSGVSTFTGRINSGHINAVGVVTATSFVGDGSGLTGVTATVVNPNSGVGTFAASVGVTTTIHTLASSIRTAEYLLFFQYNSNIQSQKILVMNNGTTAYSQEYAIMFEPNQIVSVGATVSGSNVLLQVTPKSGISGVTTFRYSAQTLE